MWSVSVRDRLCTSGYLVAKAGDRIGQIAISAGMRSS
jgi:hypothetical protein